MLLMYYFLCWIDACDVIWLYYFTRYRYMNNAGKANYWRQLGHRLSVTTGKLMVYCRSLTCLSPHGKPRLWGHSVLISLLRLRWVVLVIFLSTISCNVHFELRLGIFWYLKKNGVCNKTAPIMGRSEYKTSAYIFF
jgi:hypothetical protein